MELSKIADQIANEYQDTLDFETIRDLCDLRSGGELSSYALDMLTDMTLTRLTKNTKKLPRINTRKEDKI